MLSFTVLNRGTQNRSFSTFIYSLLLSSTLFFGYVPESHAISLDGFAGDPDAQSLTATGLGGTSGSVVNDNSAIGGTRSVELLSTSSLGILSFFAGDAGIPLMNYSQSASKTGSALIVYDGDNLLGLTDPQGLGRGGQLDLYNDGASALLLEVIKFDFPNAKPLDITVTVYDAGDPLGQTYSMGTISLNASLSNHVESLDFAALGGFPVHGPGGHADFSNIGAITIYIDGQFEAHDLEIRLLGTNGECTHVPVNGLIKNGCNECNKPDPDADGDGTLDCNEACPNDPLKLEPGLCGCGVSDVDTDHDTVPDCKDQCDNDPLKAFPGVCGCGVADTDTDHDGTPDCHETCDNDPLKTSPGVCGCGVSDLDSDQDGTADCNETCDSDPLKTSPGACGCGVVDTDTDGDGTADCNEDCDSDPTKIAPGVCGCGIADTDTDGDGTADCNETCDNDAQKTSPGICGCGVSDVDSDGDGTADCNESCDSDPLKLEAGICGCGVADTDTDGDGTPDCNDECSENSATTTPGECGCDLTIQKDRCGVCGGDGTSCLECEAFDITQTQFLLDGGAKDQEKLILNVLHSLKRLDRSKASLAFIKESRAIAHTLQISNWTLSWELPSVFSVCSNVFCVAVSNEPQLSVYRQQSDELRQLGEKVIARLRKAMKRKNALRKGKLARYAKRNSGLHTGNISLAD
ncbi:MAG: hypothetical protein KDD60_07870, partial [Bdellovibrionales bacterium]|nr:hypothetical protein [Bdellovibrionales bacterium]